jgi:hypothetical protein
MRPPDTAHGTQLNLDLRRVRHPDATQAFTMEEAGQDRAAIADRVRDPNSLLA